MENQDLTAPGEIEVFSQEERNEISERIEAASAREAIEPPRPPAKGEAAKRSVFPLGVNAAALVLLGAGLFFLFYFHEEDTVEIRESSSVLDITARALIQEIRRESNARLDEKDEAITAMNTRIAEVDGELERLDSLEALTDEQRRTMETLRLQQEEYRTNLVRLQVERAGILMETRRQEAEARQTEARQAEARRRDSALLEEAENLSPQARAEIQAARESLAALSGVEEKAALVEKQLSGYYAAASRQIREGRYREAAGTVAALREFLATPGFQSLKLIQDRRESDAAAVDAFSALITEALKSEGTSPAAASSELPPVPSGAGAEAELRRQLAERNAVLASREQALAELQKSVGDLEERNTLAQQTLAERERQMESLQAQNAANLQKIETLQRTISNVNAALGD